LLAAEIPMPSLAERREVLAQLAHVERSTHVEEEEPAETWWHLADLRVVTWHVALATPDPRLLQDGMPLEVLCGEITRGRDTRRHAIPDAALGYLPVSDVSVLGGKPPRRWMLLNDPTATVAHRGDLLVAGLGNYAYATVAEGESIADQHVYVLRLRDVATGPAIAAYLNSQRGYRVRQLMLTGSTIPSLRGTDLAAIPIPDDALHAPVGPQVAPVPIARRLENLLWRN